MTVEDHGTEAMALPKRFENNGLILEFLLLEELPNMARESLLPRSFVDPSKYWVFYLTVSLHLSNMYVLSLHLLLRRLVCLGNHIKFLVTPLF